MVGIKLNHFDGRRLRQPAALVVEATPRTNARVLLRLIYGCLGRSLTAKISSGTTALAAIQASANNSAPCENTTTFTVA